MYSNCCCSCWFEAEIIKIGQSSHNMYSSNILNFQESMTILNAHTKKVWKLIVCASYLSPFGWDCGICWLQDYGGITCCLWVVTRNAWGQNNGCWVAKGAIWPATIQFGPYWTRWVVGQVWSDQLAGHINSLHSNDSLHQIASVSNKYTTLFYLKGARSSGRVSIAPR